MVRVRMELLRAHDEGLEAPDLRCAVAEALRIEEAAVESVVVARRSLDARSRLRRPTWQLSVDVDLRGPLPSAARSRVSEVPAPTPRLESPPARRDDPPIVVVGAGPAGLFAAWHLPSHGARVVLVERGKPVERRARDFGRFRGRGILDPESNLCFGEGGAGTYSDGKLTTRKKDPRVRERLVEVGAPAQILIEAKPHIGTNRLVSIPSRAPGRLEPASL